MLTEVQVRNSRSPTLELPLFESDTMPIQIRNIEGLGPVKAVINTSPFAVTDGESYFGSSVGKRNIVITFGLNPDWRDLDISDLRQILYTYFMPKQPVSLRFITDHMPNTEIAGYVESMDPSMFSKDPEIPVSIICPKPDLVSVDMTTVNGVVTDGNTEVPLTYLGTEPSGYELIVKSSAARPGYAGKLTNKLGLPYQTFSVDSAVIDATRYFHLSTVPGNRFVRTVQVPPANDPTAYVYSSLLNSMSSSDWPMFLMGAPSSWTEASIKFSVAALNAGQAWTLNYFNRFGGI